MFDKPLTLGMVGEHVATLHLALAEHGLSIPEDETKRQFFGPATQMAVNEFQKAHGITSSGEVNTATVAKLETPLIKNTVATINQPQQSAPQVQRVTTQQAYQPSSKPTIPAHLSLFALSKKTGHPIAHMPFYAEVAVISALPRPTCNLQEAIQKGILTFISTENANVDAKFRVVIRVSSQQVAELFCEPLYRLLAPEIIEHWVRNQANATSAVVGILQIASEVARRGGIDASNLQGLDKIIEEAILAYAKENRLPLATTNDTQIAWAHPMGVLATDHVGYLSFDLTRLPPDVVEALALALEARRLNPSVPTKTSIWVYPMVRDEDRFDVMEQMRFAHDAIVFRLELDLDPCQPELCDSPKNSGFPSMQNPDLTDWRLSPASFAVNPGALVGADGCELILPSNIALHEFNFYQVIGMPAGDVHLPIDPAASGKVRPGFINEYRLSFIPIGHALGQILYSMPLAPGESVNLAVIDWTRRDDAQRTEHTTLDEKIIHDEHRDRTISETVNASIKEFQHGSSFMGGIAGSYGAALGASGIGAAIGLSGSLGGSTASSSGTRNITGTTVQKLSDNIMQTSTAMRELQSTVVVHSTQTEHEAIETRTVVNYNHSHSLNSLSSFRV